MIAEGVNGLLIARSETLVVCAFSKVAESLSTLRGFGGFSTDGVGRSVDWDVRELVNCLRIARVEFMMSCSALESAALGGAMSRTRRLVVLVRNVKERLTCDSH